MTSLPTRRTGPRWWRSVAPTLLVFVLVTSAAGLAAAVLRHAEHRHADATLDRRTETTATAVTADVGRYLDAVQDLTVAVAAQTETTSDDFETITSRVRPGRLSGAGAVLLIQPDGQVRYVRAVAGQPTEDRDETLLTAPDPAAPDRSAVRLAETVEAMDASRTSGRITASRIVTTARSGPGQRPDPASAPVVMVLVAPVFGGASTHDPGVFRGWLLMTVRSGEFLARSIASATAGAVRVTLVDTTDPTHPVPVIQPPEGVPDRVVGPTRRVDLPVAQRTWRLTIAPSRPLATGVWAHTDEAALVVGVLLATLLAGMAWLLATSRERALQRLDQATTALRTNLARRETVEARLRDRETELAGFVAVAAHDLRTPLTNVAAYADLLAEMAADDLDLTCRGFVERIATGARRTTRLVEDLLDFAAADTVPLRVEQVDLSALVADVVAEHLGYLGDDRPNVEVGPLPTVAGDLTALRRLFDNLIGNAIKYVRHGDTAQVGVDAHPEPDGWRIEVTDHGIGIAGEQRAAVFAAFHRDRAAEGYPGAGLGLAICQRIVNRHGGRIGVEANPGGGSRFWFILPTVVPGEASPGDAGQAPAATLTGTR